MQSCLVWFVGVFSQVDLYSTDIENATLNSNLISSLFKSFNNIYCMICVKDESEKLAFEKLIAKDKNLLKCKFIFRPYGKFDDILLSPEFQSAFTEPLAYFIDSNTYRLSIMNRIFPSVKCLHLSQFIS